jgi:hypothetical protein
MGEAWNNKSIDMDKRIARLRDMTARLRDEQMLDDIFSLIAELEAQSARFMPSHDSCGNQSRHFMEDQ